MKNDLTMRHFLFVLMLVFLSVFTSGCIDLAANLGRNKHADADSLTYGQGEVYAMRGGLGGVFSIGMNRLEDKFKHEYHIHSTSTVWYKSSSLSALIIKRYKAHELSGPIILVGHSLGANDQIKVARALYREDIPVALLLTVDAVSPLPVPPNVKTVLNIYKPSYIPLSGGYALTAMDPSSTSIENFNVSHLDGVYVNHWIITMNPVIQKIMIDKIVAVLNQAKTNQVKSNQVKSNQVRGLS